MSYEVQIRRQVRERIANWKLPKHEEQKFFEAVLADLETHPLESLIKISAPTRAFEYTRKIEYDGLSRTLGLWFELLPADGEKRPVLRALDAFDITVNKLPTGRTLPVQRTAGH